LVVRLGGAEDGCAASDVCDRVVFDVVLEEVPEECEPPTADGDSSWVASFSLAGTSFEELLEDSSEWLLEWCVLGPR
jgi:hypothetical protein